MKVSEKWLREWVNPPLNRNEIAEQLTLAGLEVESLNPVSGQFTDVVIGYIQSVTAHPNASRLQVCQVDIGAASLLNIVCGAANARAGLKVAVACLGASLPNNVKIEEVEKRGVISQGMLCSGTELGLNLTNKESEAILAHPSKESEGILELPFEAPIGHNLHDYLELADFSIDIHLTPNRGDCLSVKGIARDLAALTDSPLRIPAIPAIGSNVIKLSEQYPISIESVNDCPRYCGRIIRGINSQAQSPIWLTERLRRSGFRSIHPAVDVTNYVLLELGQPLHAFDLSKLNSEIVIRRARKDEKIVLLDGKEVCLDEDTVVIADKVQVQAIAGVMGGSDSSISATTTDIFLESAFFYPTALAGRARYYGLNSESAYRFERGVDPELLVTAIERATQLLIEIVGGKVGPIVKRQGTLPAKQSITLHQSHVKKILGISLTENEIETIFRRLGMTFKQTYSQQFDLPQNIWQVTPPSWRFDLHREVDLIEELARIHGYSKIPSAFPRTEQHFPPGSEVELPLSRLRHLLVDRDYHEAITYSFISPKFQKTIDPQQTPFVLVNPISEELSVMRTSLWPGLLNAAMYNQKRQQARVRLFETGLCFQTESGALSQKPYLAAIAQGNNVAEQWGLPEKPLDFFTVKADVESILRLTGQLANSQFMPIPHPALHPGQSSQIVQGEQVIGYLGALHPKLVKELDLAGPIYLFELSLSALTQEKLPTFKSLSKASVVGGAHSLSPEKLATFKSFSKFPWVRRDLSFWIEEEFTAQRILEQVKIDAGELLHDTYLFDIYYDKEKQKQRRSMALAILWQDTSRTLVDKEVDDLLKNVIAGLKQHFTIQLREKHG